MPTELWLDCAIVQDSETGQWQFPCTTTASQRGRRPQLLVQATLRNCGQPRPPSELGPHLQVSIHDTKHLPQLASGKKRWIQVRICSAFACIPMLECGARPKDESHVLPVMISGGLRGVPAMDVVVLQTAVLPEANAVLLAAGSLRPGELFDEEEWQVQGLQGIRRGSAEARLKVIRKGCGRSWDGSLCHLYQ